MHLNVGLARYAALRLLRAAATVFGVVTLLFCLLHFIPGNPVRAILGDQASPEEVTELTRALRLDRPLAEQYLSYLREVADGSLGYSFRQRTQSVSHLIAGVLPHTLLLALAATIIAWLLGVPLGALAALHQGSGWDRAASAFAMTGIALPRIWLGPLLVLLFGVWLRWLPLPGDEPTRLRALVLPAFTVGTALAALLARQTRVSLIEVLGQQYIVAARARGVGPCPLLFKHALRNAMLPVLTVSAAQIAAVVSGSVVTEKIFERPGLGTLFLEAFFNRDIPVIQGCVLAVAVFCVLINLAADLLYGAVDPRIRYV
jgi:peptide/nickel transport system permease protein